MESSKSHEKQAIDRAIQRVRGGDAEAFEVVVRAFEQPLRAWLAVQSPPGVDVDDIAQKSFVAAFTGLANYQCGSDFGGWLFTIARYQLKTETTRLRRIADYHTRYAPDLLQKELDRRASEAPQVQQTRLEYLQLCLDELSESIRRYVTWRYDEQISLQEMAERSGRSVVAVKKQLWKLRRNLHDCIESRLRAAGDLS